MEELGFPLGVRLTHWFNLLFIILIARSGLAILAAHPKLYWTALEQSLRRLSLGSKGLGGAPAQVLVRGAARADIACHPQTILAYELNGQELPLQSGAPLRVRFETKLGFKMVKFLRAIEFVEDYRKIGKGRGGGREDEQQYDKGAEI